MTTNADAILVINGGSSLLISTSSSNAGTLQAGGASPGTINFNSDVLNNTGGVLNADVGGLITVSGVSVFGGSLNSVGTGRFAATNNGNNFLDAVTLNGTLDLASITGSVRVVNGLTLNGLTLNGTININSNSILSFEGNQTLGGTGAIVFGDTSNYSNRIDIEGDSTLTVGSGVVVHGQNGTIGNQYFIGGTTRTLINQGTISADVGGGVISIVATSTTNDAGGVLRADNGGTLSFASGNSITNQTGGSVEALTDSQVVFQNGANVINLSGNALTGGIWKANSVGGTSATIDFQGTGTTIATDNADIYLIGANSVILGTDVSNVSQSIDNTLSTNNSALRLHEGRTFNATANSGDFTNNGIL